MIVCFEGGIGTGKTLSMVTVCLDDLDKKSVLYTNVRLMNLPSRLMNKVKYITKEQIGNIFEMIKTGKMDMKNSMVMLQEAHNYIDSRNSMKPKNKAISYWILQSRHSGEGSCDILFDTQSLSQVDIRLRQNTDYLMQPYIVERDKDGLPMKVLITAYMKLLHKIQKANITLDVYDTLNKYSTYELVDF